MPDHRPLDVSWEVRPLIGGGGSEGWDRGGMSVPNRGLPPDCSPPGPFQTKNMDFYRREIEYCRKALGRTRVKSSVCLEA